MKRKAIIALILLFVLILSAWFFIKPHMSEHYRSTQLYKSIIEQPFYFSFIDGYTYHLGDTVKISKFGKTDVGYFDVKNLINDSTFTISTTPQMVDLSNEYFNELRCDSITDLFVPERSGIYMFSYGNEDYTFRDAVFVNEAVDNSEKRIKIVLSDYNWVCYNEFGGRSNYSDFITPKWIYRYPLNKYFGTESTRRSSYFLNIYRPNLINSNELNTLIEDDNIINGSRFYHCIVAEIPLIKLLFDEYPNSFEIIDCFEFENLKSGVSDNLYIFNGHAEYWTDRMMGKLRTLKSSNNILFFSGNNIYREVERIDRALIVINNLIDQQITTGLTGSYYNTRDYGNYSEMQIIDKSNFLFKGIDKSIIGGKYVISHEFDKINKFTDENVKIIAIGKDVECDIILMDNENGYYLLNTGSIGSYSGLDDDNFRKFINNFINYSLGVKN